MYGSETLPFQRGSVPETVLFIHLNDFRCQQARQDSLRRHTLLNFPFVNFFVLMDPDPHPRTLKSGSRKIIRIRIPNTGRTAHLNLVPNEILSRKISTSICYRKLREWSVTLVKPAFGSGTISFRFTTATSLVICAWGIAYSINSWEFHQIPMFG